MRNPKELISISRRLQDYTRPSVRQFIPTRYPWTYACDYLRQNSWATPPGMFADPPDSRGTARRQIREWAERVDVDESDLAQVLALQFMKDENIPTPGPDELDKIMDSGN